MKARNFGTLGFGALMAVAFAHAPIAAAGDGLYLGLQGGANQLDDQTYKVYDADLGLGSVLAGTNFADGTKISKIDYDLGYLGGLVLGYGLKGGLRFELDLARRENDAEQQHDINRGSTKVNGDARGDTAMANLWLDFFKGGSIHPYIGGGYGAARIELDDPTFQETDLRKQKDTVGAYQAGAGLGFDLGPHWTLALDYRYLDSERGSFKFFDTEAGTSVKTDYKAQSALATLRYYFSAEEPPVEAVPPEPPVEVVPVAAPADSDGDGVTDDLDQCPGTPAGVKVNDVGCPLPACKTPEPGQPVTLEGCAAGHVIVLHGVTFEFDKSRLTPNAQGVLDDVGESLGKVPGVKVEIGGYTDSRGSDEYNQKLSERRAHSVVQYLVGKGIDPGRLSSAGYGETLPVADNETDEGRELNRRVELKVTEGTAIVAPLVPTPEPVPAADASPEPEASATPEGSAVP